MSREVLSSRDYQYQEQGYLVDNIPWQDEIKRRLAEEIRKRITEPRPTLDAEEFSPVFLPENPEGASDAVEAAKAPELTADEILEKAKVEAEETARSIEQSARKNAFEIIEKARWEADEILSKTREEAEKEILRLKESAVEDGKKQGLEQGRQEGFEKGRLEGLETYTALIQKWDKLLVETASERKRLLGELHPMLVELVGEALHRCLKKEAKRHGQMAIEFAQEVLKKAQDRVHLKLHVHPDDAEEVELQKEPLQLSVGAGELEIVPDARIEKGGCLLETEAGTIDARLSTVVDQVKESLASQMPAKKPGESEK